MKVKVLAILGLLMMFVTSCKKEIAPMKESNDPVFRTDFTLNGDDYHLVAGDAGAYMNTMTLIENRVQVFSGKMENPEVSVELGIFDGGVDMPNQNPIEGMVSFVPSFAEEDMGELMVLSKSLLSTLPNSQNISSIAWYVNGEHAGNNTVVLSDAGIFEVCASVTFYGGVTKEVCNDVIVGYNRAANYTIGFDVLTGDSVQASIVSDGPNVQEVKWLLEGNEIGNGESVVAIVQGEKVLTAQVKLDNGVVRTKSVIVSNDPSHTLDDFTKLENIASTLSRDYSFRLNINVGGNEWRSEIADNENSTIGILGIEYYGVNNAGKDVYKVEAIIDAFVRQTLTSKAVPVHVKTIFGIEVP